VAAEQSPSSGLPSHRAERNADLAGAMDLRDGYPDVLDPEAEGPDQRRAVEDLPNLFAWDALACVHRDAAAVLSPAHLRRVADAEKLAAPEPDAPARDGSRSADLAAALPAVELYTPDGDQSAEQSFAAQAPVDAVAALAQSDVELVVPDSRVLYSRPERGLMERS